MAEKNIPEETNPDIVSVLDDDGVEHLFEELDRIETDDGKYVALIPVPDENDITDDEDEGVELIILKVEDEGDNTGILAPIEDENEFDEVAKIFEERLIETDE